MDIKLEDLLYIEDAIIEVFYTLNKIKNYYEITDKELNKALKYKVNRTLTRINENYY